jgi:hypothetical protein
VALFEEFDRQDCGQAPENIEIIPFDDVSRRRGSDDASEVCWNALSHSYLPCCRRSTFRGRGNSAGHVILPPG